MKKSLLLLIFYVLIGSAYPQWTLLNDEIKPNYAITAYDSIVIAGAGFYGPYDLAVSYDFGNNWVSLSHSPPWNRVYQLCSGITWVYACTAEGLFRTAKNDLNWSSYNQGLTSLVTRIIERDSILLAIGDSVLFKRGLVDDSWSVLSDNSLHHYIHDLDYNGSIIILGGSAGVSESNDMGESWTIWNGYSFVPDAVVIKGDTMIAASPGGVGRKLISTGQVSMVSSGLDKLWTPPPGWDYYGSFEQFLTIGDNIFLCGETGLYKLKEDQWYWEHTGLEYWTYGMAHNEESLFAVKGYDGIWGRPLDQLIVSVGGYSFKEDAPKVYPNPCTGPLTIEAKALIRELRVYNDLGQLIWETYPSKSILIYDFKEARPGIYFLQMKVDEQYFIQRVIRLDCTM